MTTEAAAAEKNLEAAIAEVEAATAAVAPAAEESDLAKALSGAIDRLETLAKGGFGDTAKAHNGQSLDKSAPAGDGKPSGGYASTDAEQNPGDGSAGRVSASQKVKTKTAAPATELNKGDQDEDDDDDDDDKKDEEKDFAFKSQAAVTEDSIVKGLTTGEGSDEYMQVVEASDAIAHQADVFAKAISAVSAQVVALSKEVHTRMDTLEKSQAAIAEGATALLKSQAQLAKDTDILKKAPAQPASGIVVVAPRTDAPSSGTAPTLLAKSITVAGAEGKIEPELASRLLAKLTTQSPAQVWETLSSDIREAIGGAGTSK